MVNCKQCSAPLPETASFCEACGAPVVARPTEDPLLGRTLLNQYVIREKLGEGGFGAVYVADQPSMGRKVAIKTLHRHLTHNSSIVARFRREGIAASRLQHASSVKMLNCGETEDGLLWMAMEFLEGRTLDKILREDGPLDPKQFVEVMGPICEVLAEAHEKGIIHRDLKPENIMLVPYPGGKVVPKVLDFGIAGLLDSNDNATRTGMIVGTPQYMSPEQWQGLKHADSKSDIYSLGVIAYQALTARLPFEADTTPGWMAKHCTEEPLDFSKVAPAQEIPLALQRAVMRALAKDPAARYSSTLEFKQALEEALSGNLEDTLSEQENISPVPPDPERNIGTHAISTGDTGGSRVPWLAAGAIALGAVVAAVIFIPPILQPAPPAEPEAPASTPTAQPQTQPQTPTTLAVTPVSIPTTPPPPTPLSPPKGMLRFEGGLFEMGSEEENDQNPKTRVRIEPFFLDRTEVSIAAYQECVDAGVCRPPEKHNEWKGTPRHPVVNVTFQDAQQFCAWRAAKDQVKTRLPTESEWEFAARDGKPQRYPWGDTWNAKAAFSGHNQKKPLPHPVDEVPPAAPRDDQPINLIGNVAEWVDSPVPESLDPSCQPDLCRVVRGGSYQSLDPAELSATYRNWDQSAMFYFSRGFRCAADAR